MFCYWPKFALETQKKHVLSLTFPFTLWMGSTTTATALSDSASKLCCVLMSTPDSQQPNPGWEWYQPTTISGLRNTNGCLLKWRYVSWKTIFIKLMITYHFQHTHTHTQASHTAIHFLFTYTRWVLWAGLNVIKERVGEWCRLCQNNGAWWKKAHIQYTQWVIKEGVQDAIRETESLGQPTCQSVSTCPTFWPETLDQLLPHLLPETHNTHTHTHTHQTHRSSVKKL